jgi:hypothetical protein
MAEIRVQEKRGGLAWLWILLLLVLAALAAWWFMSNRDASTTEPAPASTPAAAPAADPTIPKHPPPATIVFVRA